MRIPISNEHEPMHEKVNLVLRQYAKELSHKYTYGKFLSTWEKQQEPIQENNLEIADNDLVLGFTSLNYSVDNLVTAPLNIVENIGGRFVSHPRLYLFIGEKGTGKSIQMTNVVLDNIVRKFGVHALFVDPSPVGEHHLHSQPITSMQFEESTQQKINDLLYNLSLKPRGYTNIAYRPNFDTSFQEEGIDKDYTLTYQDFKDMYYFSKTEAVQSLIDMLELQGSRAATNVIIQIFNDPSIKTFGEALSATAGAHEFRGMDDEQIKVTGSAFQTYLQTAMLLGVVTDKPSTVNFLKDLSEKDYVVLRTKLSNLDITSPIQTKYLIYVNTILNNILRDRLRFISGNEYERRKSYLNNDYGIVIAIDEADALAPRGKESYTKTTIENLVLKYRKAGVSVALATQTLGNLSENLVKQADVIFCSQLTTAENIQALRERDISRETIRILQHLRKHERNSLGLSVSEWAYINTQNEEIRSFYPSVPLSMFKMPERF